MDTLARGRIIGVDFDNTIAGYDHLLYEVATGRNLIGADVARNKKAIRDAVRMGSEGEACWRSLQSTVYGPRMSEARPLEGAAEFFAACRRMRLPAYIVSHKTQYATFGEPGVNLREAAMAWLQQHGFFDPDGPGLCKSDVFFESTRAEKIARIKALQVTHFIDDLEEVFVDASFPGEVAQILIATHSSPDEPAIRDSFASWAQIRAHLFGGAPAL